MALMILVNNPGSWSTKYPMLSHAEWNGFTPTDFVFPNFLFIMGVSMFFSLRKSNFSLSWKMGKRFLLLFGFGLTCNAIGMLVGGRWSLEHFRILGVLQRFALCFGATALLVCLLDHKWLGWIAAGLLLLYSILLLAFNGYVQGPESIIYKFDSAILGENHLYRYGNGIDPEGLLSTISAIAHTIIGFIVGKILFQKDFRKMDSLGTGMLVGGLLLMWLLPLNKKIWSPSFVLVACGLGTLLLGLFHYLIDEKSYLKHIGFWKVFGSNAIYCYLIAHVYAWCVSLSGIRGPIMDALGENNFTSLLYAIFSVLLVWLATVPLYKKKIFLKL